MIDQSSRSVPPSGKLGPGSLDRIVHQHMPAGVKLPLVSAAEHHHLRPQHRGRCMAGDLEGVEADNSVRTSNYSHAQSLTIYGAKTW